MGEKRWRTPSNIKTPIETNNAPRNILVMMDLMHA
jgi:hypothetical protein